MRSIETEEVTKRKERDGKMRDKTSTGESIITISVDDLSSSYVLQVECNWTRDLLLRHLEDKLMYRKREREKRKGSGLEQQRRKGKRSPSVWSPLLNYTRLVYSRVLEGECVCIVTEIELITAIAQ